MISKDRDENMFDVQATNILEWLVEVSEMKLK